MTHSFFLGTSVEDFQVNQPESSVSAKVGDVITLGCNIPAPSPAGPVLWFKDTRLGRKLIYSFNGRQFPRVSQVVNPMANQTDYSIRISDVSPKDAGMYYCVKLTIGHPDMAYIAGPGTYVSVNGKYSLTNSVFLIFKICFLKSSTCIKSLLYTGYCTPSLTICPIGWDFADGPSDPSGILCPILNQAELTGYALL